MSRWAGACLLLAVVVRGDISAQAFDPIPSSAQITVEMVELAADRMLADEAYPPEPRPPGPLPRDLQILMNAESSPFANVRRAFLRVLGRFESSGDVERIISHLAEPDWTVRRQAAESIGQAFARTKPGEAARVVQLTFDVLQVRLQQESNVDVLAAALSTLADLPCDQVLAFRIEKQLVSYTHPIFPRPGAAVAGAALDALESFIGRSPGRPVTVATRNRLRELAAPRVSPADLDGPRLRAIEALQTLHDTDVQTITAAARYSCAPFPLCGWEIRRVAVQMMNGAQGTFAQALGYALGDGEFHVRIAALQTIARAIPETQECGRLIGALSDPVVAVVTTAIDLLDRGCRERDEIVSRLQILAGELSGSPSGWHAPVHALLALARFDPVSAKKIANETAATHDVWHVRAAAANVSSVVGDDALALRLTDDAEANVRTEALKALLAMKSASIADPAIKALKSGDFQLVLTAASVLKTAKGREAAVPDLIDALRRLTGPDTSREARLEIWARLREFAAPDPEQLGFLSTLVRDYDPLVAFVAAEAVSAWSGVLVKPNPTRRIAQPTEAELQVPWLYARVDLDTGDRFLLVFDRENAPITVARFVKLALAHFYDGASFYRVAADLEATGGSPGANDYAGDSRFARDEIGHQHGRGHVRLETRGWIAGDMRFSIELVDLPRLNRTSTVFATVSGGERPHCLIDPIMKILDGFERPLEGVKIASITLPPVQAPPLACY